MALQLSSLVRIGTAFGRTVWLYRHAIDAIAAVQGSGYFNGASSSVADGDWVLAEGADGAAVLYILSNSGGVVTTAAATDGAAVSALLLDLTAAPRAVPYTPDTEANRDLVLIHSAAAGASRLAYADHLAIRMRQAVRSGRYYGGDVANPGVTTTFTVAANTLYALPFLLHRQSTFSDISAQVTTLHASNMRLGIYANSSCIPGDLILDAGEVSAGSTGIKDLTLGTYQMDPGIYWLASVYAGTPTVRAAGFHTAAANMPDIMSIMGIATPGSFDTRLTASLTYGALPASFGTISRASGESPGVWLKGVS